MKVKPLFDRASESNYGLIASYQHQVFGYMEGVVTLDDGTKLEIKDFLCAVEVVRNRY